MVLAIGRRLARRTGAGGRTEVERREGCWTRAAVSGALFTQHAQKNSQELVVERSLG